MHHTLHANRASASTMCPGGGCFTALPFYCHVMSVHMSALRAASTHGCTAQLRIDAQSAQLTLVFAGQVLTRICFCCRLSWTRASLLQPCAASMMHCVRCLRTAGVSTQITPRSSQPPANQCYKQQLGAQLHTQTVTGLEHLAAFSHPLRNWVEVLIVWLIAWLIARRGRPAPCVH